MKAGKGGGLISLPFSDLKVKKHKKRNVNGKSVYDLLNCLILDYTNCPKTAQFYAQNGSLISPEYSGDITLSNYFVKFF